MARDTGGMTSKRKAKGKAASPPPVRSWRGGAGASANANASTSTSTTAGASTTREEPAWARSALLTLLMVSSVMLGVRLYAAYLVGFGDSEALYACWAAHPQPAYLDHPGLLGVVARAIGENAIPTPLRAHVITSNIATLVPWSVYGTARVAGADRGRAAIAGLVVALVPETAVGLFALTPDLLLAPAWLGVLALASIGLRAKAGSTRSAAAFLGAGLVAGTASAAKVSGLLLVVALVAAYGSIALSRGDGEESRGEGEDGDAREDGGRAAVRTIWPWAGVLAGLVVLAPIARYEAKVGWPMLHHRFVDTQHGAGVALRNMGALVGGQVAYLSPVFAFLAVLAAYDLFRQRGRDAISRLLFLAFAVPIVPLVALSSWSPVAEPHWIAPALLALPIHVARRVAGRADASEGEEEREEEREGQRGVSLTERSLGSRRLFVIAAAVAGALTLFVHAWVLVPSLSRLLPAGTDPKLDITTELYGWPRALDAVREQMAGAGTPFDPEGREVVVVGPHWTVCAQLKAGLPGVRVGCATPVKDDFDTWLPRDHWRAAEHVLFVTDNRYPGDGAEQLPGHVQSAQSRVRILRAGRTARVFELYLYDRRAQGSL